MAQDRYYFGALGLVVFFTLLGVGVAVFFPNQKRVAAACLDMSKIGAGAIFGLIAGRAITPPCPPASLP